MSAENRAENGQKIIAKKTYEKRAWTRSSLHGVRHQSRPTMTVTQRHSSRLILVSRPARQLRKLRRRGALGRQAKQ